MTTDEPTQDYFILKPVGSSPRIRGEFDSFLTRWPDTLSFIEEYLEDIEDGDSAALIFLHRKWTHSELEKYCEENDIDPVYFGKDSER